jgi:hypothetical protein
VKRKERIELVSGRASLASSEGKHRCTKTCLSGLTAGRESRVRLPQRCARVCVATFVHREVGKKNQRRTGKRITRVAAKELAQHSSSAPRLTRAQQRPCALIRGSRKERRGRPDSGKHTCGTSVAAQSEQRNPIRVSIRGTKRRSLKNTRISSGSPAPPPTRFRHVRNGQLLGWRKPHACGVQNLDRALGFTSACTASNDGHEPAP